MSFSMGELLSRRVFFPLWEIHERADRLRELKRLRASQWWQAERLRKDQLRRFDVVFKFARTHSPFYRETYGSLPNDFSIESLTDIARLPTVQKHDLRARTKDILTQPKELLVKAKTGGSTGVALDLWFTQRTQEYRNAAEMRSAEWAGRPMGARTAFIWGNTPTRFTLKERLRNELMNRCFYLDTMLINEQSVRAFSEQWQRLKGRCIMGHAHSVYVLACYLRDLGISITPPDAIVTSSMMLLAAERAVIEQVFSCPVTNRYGCEEVGMIACECEMHSGLHINSEHVFVEIVGADGLPTDGEGEVVVTDLINTAMPLIRYRIGDHAQMSARSCACGRGLPLLEKIVGRTADFLRKTDGSRVAGVSLVERTLTAIPGLERMQIIQQALTQFRINVVPDGNYSQSSRDALVAEMQSVFGTEVRFDVVEVENLEIARNGKHRFSICNING